LLCERYERDLLRGNHFFPFIRVTYEMTMQLATLRESY